MKVSGGVVHHVPADLRKALLASRPALAAWEGLTPLARNEWICWMVSVQKEETRRDHLKRIPAELRGGKRRPCCWMGCIHRTDKKISPSVKGVLAKRAKN